MTRTSTAVAVAVAVAIAGVLAALLAWYYWPQTLEATRPRIGPAITAVYASGTVEASVMLPVAPRVGGRLVALNSDEHSVVHRGQVLGRLESSDLDGNLDQLLAQEKFARSDFDRYAALLREGAVARQTYERAQTTWQAAEASVRQARAQTEYMSLLAPDDCTVIERNGEAGQFIAANVPVFWLSCRNELRISAQVDEEDITLVKPGQKVLIRADAFPGRVFNGKVAEMTPKGDPVGRSYRVRIALPADSPFQIGMTTEANIIICVTSDAVLVPDTAVKDNKVWKVIDSHATRADVVTGVKSNGWVQIVRGVTRGDSVLRDGTVALAQGQILKTSLAER